MILKLDPNRWIDGFKDAYAERPAQTRSSDDHSYSLGRVEGEALRLKHQQEYEQQLFDGRRIRPAPNES